MPQKLRQALVRNWIGVLMCLVLGSALFALGYWQGQRSARQAAMQEWRQQNAARFQQLQQQEQALAQATAGTSSATLSTPTTK